MASAEKVTVQEERVVVEERDVIRVELTEREALILHGIAHHIDREHALDNEVRSILFAIGSAAGATSASSAMALSGVGVDIKDEFIAFNDRGHSTT